MEPRDLIDLCFMALSSSSVLGHELIVKVIEFHISFIYSLEDLRLPGHIDLRLNTKDIRCGVMKGNITRASRLKVDYFLRKDLKRKRSIG
jgi:hypothetical protein